MVYGKISILDDYIDKSKYIQQVGRRYIDRLIANNKNDNDKRDRSKSIVGNTHTTVCTRCEYFLSFMYNCNQQLFIERQQNPGG